MTRGSYLVEGIPKFACDPELLAFHETVFDRTIDALTGLHLVAVIAGTVCGNIQFCARSDREFGASGHLPKRRYPLCVRTQIRYMHNSDF
jgi:hypothetical protein